MSDSNRIFLYNKKYMRGGLWGSNIYSISIFLYVCLCVCVFVDKGRGGKDKKKRYVQMEELACQYADFPSFIHVLHHARVVCVYLYISVNAKHLQHDKWIFFWRGQLA